MTLEVADEDKAETALGMTALIFRREAGIAVAELVPRRRGVSSGWSGVDANSWPKTQPRTGGRRASCAADGLLRRPLGAAASTLALCGVGEGLGDVESWLNTGRKPECCVINAPKQSADRATRHHTGAANLMCKGRDGTMSLP